MFFIIGFMLFVGLGAGVITGLIGASAVGFVVPMLVVVMNVDPYIAIGISLAIDVSASFFASRTYFSHGNLDLKTAGQISVPAVTGAIFGSWFSSYIPSAGLGGLAGLVTVVMGVNFMRKPMDFYVETFKRKIDLSILQNYKHIFSAIFAFAIGIICGTMGAGGGIMILLVLVFVLDYKIHEAVGTSVMIMVFTALFGSAAHVVFGDFLLYYALIGCVGGAIGAHSAASFANITSEKMLGKIVGVIFVLLGSLMIVKQYFII